jgi:enoyl-CoA hydratase/carnithine racemase
MGGTVRFYDLMRDDVIRELAFTGRTFNAEEAHGYGMVTRVVPDPLGQAMTSGTRNRHQEP